MYERIRNLREDKDLKQRELAAFLSCAQRTYSSYECGVSDIPTQILIKLSEYHGVSVDYLLGLTDEKRAYPRKRQK